MEKISGIGAKKKIYTVSELTREIRFILENSFPAVWVEGEVSNFTRHSSGHCYLSLKDSESVISCVIFKNIADTLKFDIKDGVRLICFGRISLYNKRGQYQFYIEEAEPKGVGALQLAFEQLKEKLQKQGLFDQSHKRAIPILPSRIGVVTSPTGAAIKDILNVIGRRFPNMHIILYPAKVQGDGASQEVKEGIEAFNRLKNVDVIIVGRGGGSLEDLWAFNEEVLARAIYNSGIPIISAVGHEIDYTIADFVADLRAPTPSAAAEIVAGKKEDFLNNIENLNQRLKSALMAELDSAKNKLEALKQRYAFKQPLFLIQQNFQRTDDQTKALNQNINHFLQEKQHQLDNLSSTLKALNPTAILSRGYSITARAADGKIIKDAEELNEGDIIKTRLAKGEVESRVEKKDLSTTVAEP
ncbi:MAG: exodeoxyribonuclease VII large subunit [Candidatus Omnitrophota bacterium]